MINPNDFITPMPPFMAGMDRLNQAINQIRQARIERDQLAQQKAIEEAQLGQQYAKAAQEKAIAEAQLEQDRAEAQAASERDAYAKATKQAEYMQRANEAAYEGDPARLMTMQGEGNLLGIQMSQPQPRAPVTAGMAPENSPLMQGVAPVPDVSLAEPMPESGSFIAPMVGDAFHRTVADLRLRAPENISDEVSDAERQRAADTFEYRTAEGQPVQTINMQDVAHSKAQSMQPGAAALSIISRASDADMPRAIQLAAQELARIMPPEQALKAAMAEAARVQQLRSSERNARVGAASRADMFNTAAELRNYNAEYSRAERNAMQRWDLGTRIKSITQLDTAWQKIQENNGALNMDVVYAMAKARDNGVLSNQDVNNAPGFRSILDKVSSWIQTNTEGELTAKEKQILVRAIEVSRNIGHEQLRRVQSTLEKQRDSRTDPIRRQAVDDFINDTFGTFEWNQAGDSGDEGDDGKPPSAEEAAALAE